MAPRIECERDGESATANRSEPVNTPCRFGVFIQLGPVRSRPTMSRFISTPALLQILIRPLQTPPVSICNMLGLAQPVRFTWIHHKFRRHVVALQAAVKHLALRNRIGRVSPA